MDRLINIEHQQNWPLRIILLALKLIKLNTEHHKCCINKNDSIYFFEHQIKCILQTTVICTSQIFGTVRLFEWACFLKGLKFFKLIIDFRYHWKLAHVHLEPESRKQKSSYRHS